ncbi:hypothetical protein PMAC_001441 [Pneumocystis sp. 'macacae']|nr:hypothetical protein PMAC_001441 [Pneumocystis sp. 'macacae']
MCANYLKYTERLYRYVKKSERMSSRRNVSSCVFEAGEFCVGVKRKGILLVRTEWVLQGVQMAQDKDGNARNTSLFVRGVPVDVSSSSFASFFAEIGRVKHAMIVTDPETKKSKGYGFVSFLTHSDAENAIREVKKRALGGHFLKAEFAKPRHRSDKKALEEDMETDKLKKVRLRPFLIIRNLPWSVRKKDHAFFLEFGKYGKVVNVIVPRKKGGKMSGFAFVQMKKMSAAEEAMKHINGVEWDGRHVAVDWALSQTEWKDFLEREKKHVQDMDADGRALLSSSKSKDVMTDTESIESMESMKSASPSNELDSQKDSPKDSLIKENWKSQTTSYDNSNEKTLFVRNLSFQTTDNILFSHFCQFGRVKYARVVIDASTGKSKGTAFVCFHHKADMENCLNVYRGLTQHSHLSVNKKSSVLQNRMVDDNVEKFVLDGYLISVFPALNKEDISAIEDNNRKERRHMLGKNSDKRNIFLLNEGYIDPESSLFHLLNETERDMRNQSLIQRKKLLEKNSSLYISLTRLAVRNIPTDVSDKDLKALARKACVGFAKEVKENKRAPLTREEKLRDGNPKKGKKGIVRQAKILQEKNGRTRGCGFIEYVGHRWALMGLRWLNGRKIGSKNNENGRKRLIVEFALENINVVNRRKERENKNRKRIQLEIEDKVIQRMEKKRKRDENPDLNEEDKKRRRLSYIISRKRRERKVRKREP